MQPKVTNLGFRVNKGPLPKKINFIKNASPLQNASQLKSILGLTTTIVTYQVFILY